MGTPLPSRTMTLILFAPMMAIAPFVPLLNGVNRAIHLTRRALAKQLFK